MIILSTYMVFKSQKKKKKLTIITLGNYHILD